MQDTATPMISAVAIEDALRQLLKGEFSSLSLTFNDESAPNYQKVAQLDDAEDDISWVSDEERAKAIAENTIWTLRWYPNTPVGFCRVSASSLAALLSHDRVAARSLD